MGRNAIKRVNQSNLGELLATGLSFGVLLRVSKLDVSDENDLEVIIKQYPWLNDEGSVERVYKAFGLDLYRQTLLKVQEGNAKQKTAAINALLEDPRQVIINEIRTSIQSYLSDIAEILNQDQIQDSMPEETQEEPEVEEAPPGLDTFAEAA